MSTTLGVWGTILLGTFAYLYNKPIPLQLKIIQVRPALREVKVGAGSVSAPPSTRAGASNSPGWPSFWRHDHRHDHIYPKRWKGDEEVDGY